MNIPILGGGKIVELEQPDQLRYLLIVGFITNTTSEWKNHVKDIEFYTEVMRQIKEWCNLSDEELKAKYPSIKVRC